MSVPISRKGSDVVTRERAVGASARRACQKVGRILIGSSSGGSGLPHASSTMSNLVLEDALLRMDYMFSLQGALNEDSKGLSSAKE